MITVYRGAQAPEAIAVTITRGKTNMDLDAVERVTFVVRSADGSGTDATWTTNINDGRDESQLTATRIFSATDVDRVGVFRVMPHLHLTAGGVRRCVPFSLQVLE